MPFLKMIDDAEIYYELYGKGDPIIFLNGIMMNTLSWAGLIPAVSKMFKLILFDFRDQGHSSKMKEQYDLDLHANDLLNLLDALKIPKIHMLGLSYGGLVALKFALLNQERLNTLILPNTTSFMSNHLREIGKAWETAVELNDGEKFLQLARPFIYSGKYYETHIDLIYQYQEMLKAFLTKEWFQAFMRLSRSTRNYYISPDELKMIRIPTLLIGAEHDIIAPVKDMMTIYENISGCEFITIPQAGHAAFLERTKEFLTIVMGFVHKYSI